MDIEKTKTKISGSKSKWLSERQKKLVPQGIEQTPFYVKKAEGAILTDVDGNKFIDFSSGISATNLGHSNKKVIQAVKRQAEKFIHTCFLVAGYESYLEVAELLHKLTPGKFAKKTFFANSGAEAVENAIKIARRATGRPAIVSFTYGFHGRTLLTLSLTSKVKPYKFGFGPYAPEVYKLPYPYTYRRPAECQTEEKYVEYLLREIEAEFFAGVIDPEHVAAIIIEPVAGEGGFIICPPSYLQGLAAICKKYGILLVVDEVQTGLCRTGKWFACEWSGVVPDILVLAKSIASGLPLSAVVGRSHIMDSVQPGGLGGTFGGNPVALAAAIATLQEMQAKKLPKRALHIGEKIMKVFKKLEHESSIVGEARGLGAMCAIEIVKNKHTKEPDKHLTKKIVQKIIQRGVLIQTTGMLGNDIRALPPLIISDGELERALSVIQNTVMEFSL